MKRHLIAYDPPSEFIDRIQTVGNELKEWNKANKTEKLYELDHYDVIREQDMHDWLMNTIYDTNLRVKIMNIFETEEHFITDKEPSEQVFIDDITKSDASEVVGIENDGGDIRKYGMCQHTGYTFNFKLHRSLDYTITGLEPLSMRSVSKLQDFGVLERGIRRNQSGIRYPTSDRICRWADIVEDEWGLECKAMGSLSFSGEIEVRGGLDGFVIYDANEEVKEWCDERWGSENSRDIFMIPDEYSLYTDEEEWVPRSAIRMWWD